MMSHHSSRQPLTPKTSARNAYQLAKDGDAGWIAPATPTTAKAPAVVPPVEPQVLASEPFDIPHSTRLSFERFSEILPPEKEEFLSDKDVARRYGVTKQTIWRWQKNNSNFPKPRRQYGSARWRLSELIAYELAELGYSTDQR
jgi:prophage regulatory protein